MDYNNIDLFNSQNNIFNDKAALEKELSNINTFGVDLLTEKERQEKMEAAKEEAFYPVNVNFIEFSKIYMNRISWQWHPEIEIIIVNHGNIRFSTHESQILLSAGQGVIINANVIHSLESLESTANCSMYSTTFDPDFLFGKNNTQLLEKYKDPVTTNKNFHYLVLDEDDTVQAELLEQINGVIADNLIKNFGYELSTKARLCSFWIKLCSAIIPSDISRKSKKSISLDETRVKDIISFIENHYRRKITLDEIAECANLSKSECCRCCKRVLNVTPVEYLMRYRIFMATSILKDEEKSNVSFSELSTMVGFNNASYFNKVFREYIGCTPSQYKKKLKEDPTFNPVI